MPRVVPKGGMVEAFFEELRQLVGKAQDMEGAEIMILAFGHQQQADRSVFVEYSPQPYPGRPGDMAWYRGFTWGQLLLPKIKETVSGLDDTAVSLLTTACYSGGWALRRLLDGVNVEAAHVDKCVRQITDIAEFKLKFPKVHTFSFVGTDDNVTEFRRRWDLLSELPTAPFRQVV